MSLSVCDKIVPLIGHVVDMQPLLDMLNKSVNTVPEEKLDELYAYDQHASAIISDITSKMEQLKSFVETMSDIITCSNESEEDDESSVSESEDDDDGWETVKSKKNKRNEFHDLADSIVEKEQDAEFWVFSDDYTSYFIGFEEVCEGLEEACSSMKMHEFSHAYCPETNYIYTLTSDIRRTVASEKYIVKAKKHKLLCNHDKYVYVLCEDNLEWGPGDDPQMLDKIEFIGKYIGLANARAKAKEFKWTHAYCPELNVIYEFSFRMNRKNGKEQFSQKPSFLAPTWYEKMFYKMINDNDELDI